MSEQISLLLLLFVTGAMVAQSRVFLASLHSQPCLVSRVRLSAASHSLFRMLSLDHRPLGARLQLVQMLFFWERRGEGRSTKFFRLQYSGKVVLFGNTKDILWDTMFWNSKKLFSGDIFQNTKYFRSTSFFFGDAKASFGIRNFFFLVRRQGARERRLFFWRTGFGNGRGWGATQGKHLVSTSSCGGGLSSANLSAGTDRADPPFAPKREFFGLPRETHTEPAPSDHPSTGPLLLPRPKSQSFSLSLGGFKRSSLFSAMGPLCARTALHWTALRWAGQNIALLFCPLLPKNVDLFFSSLEVFSLNFGVCEGQSPQQYTFGLSGPSCETPAAPPERSSPWTS